MSDKPAAPGRKDAPAQADEAPQRTTEDFRLLCRRYSRLRSRTPG